MQPRVTLFIANFFYSLLVALTVYILLPYLSAFTRATTAGFVVAAGGLAAVVFFPFTARLVARYGPQQLALIFAVIEMIAVFALAAAPNSATSWLLIVVMLALQPLISYQLDLILEATDAAEGQMGRVRAVFLTAWNLGIFVAPLLIAALLADTNAYGRVFIAAGVALVPFIVLFTARQLPKIRPIAHVPMLETFLCILRNRDLAAVTAGHLVLWLFYVWAPVYVPIYFHNVLGIPWSSLGWIFSVMLIPCVLIEYPAGWLADRYLGDKELMFAGFLFAGGALASVGFITASSSLLLILFILLASRAGAALIESMTEGHFYRRVSAGDINSMSIFRSVWPLAYVIAPIIASGILYFGSYQLLFAITGGFIAIAGVIATLCIKDFR
jgi:MFS family permease